MINMKETEHNSGRSNSEKNAEASSRSQYLEEARGHILSRVSQVLVVHGQELVPRLQSAITLGQTSFHLRKRVGGHIVAPTLCPTMLPVPGKTRQHVARRADTRNVSEVYQQHILCPGHKMCFRYRCYASGKTSQRLGNMITSAMLPPQCVLVLPGPYSVWPR